jgi:hypothetical protein
MMGAALQGVAGLYEISHLLVKLIASPLLARPHLVLVEVDKSNIPHVLHSAPFPTALPRHIVRNLPIPPILLLLLSQHPSADN